MTAKENGKVYICGNYPVPKETGPGTVEENQGKFLPCSFLPVDFLSFEVALSDDRKSLVADWSTASESESSHFEVEYSRTGLADFQVLGRVAAAGHATEVQHYRFSATLPHGAEEILYLRIKQVDLDGSSYYTELRPLRLPKRALVGASWQVFPNPLTGDAFRIHYEGSIADSDAIQARLISFSHASVIIASDVPHLNGLLADAIKQVPKGMYVLELTVGTEVTRLKVIKK
ncbi:MAG: T9SS type A sorting domain-containing protein [Lunatimonas sp.]|uniref:T9SS type A sorting domain-containing protein n=1 Tax=Lunatimonas sp. TaxID=2060141 RepID=UPI00263B5FE4|nr:T9SS type A sorting domain-containing protein [Lunatimonas sp.]MCC5936727.1 T9SS type A sorting domain-containing protein [Lunatimonas sp.]